MPLYEHRCKECGYVTTKICKYDDKVQVCTHCGGEANRIMSSPGHIDGNFYNAEEKKHIRESIHKLEKRTGISQGGH